MPSFIFPTKSEGINSVSIDKLLTTILTLHLYVADLTLTALHAVRYIKLGMCVSQSRHDDRRSP
ncbi:hypothetical protein M413DRAFT_130440 [Hebeloma cylindrosporum]|uniref:Uncharacterized protein n=1 Tax=Hebeloma cylindrosporum TaxID=76867 RepID=A0A0C3CF89_HEBCY|nr:hypothetical protein M413DRAFT_130440 [Hebeloma cylindrosporum h7]